MKVLKKLEDKLSIPSGRFLHFLKMDIKFSTVILLFMKVLKSVLNISVSEYSSKPIESKKFFKFVFSSASLQILSFKKWILSGYTDKPSVGI